MYIWDTVGDIYLRSLGKKPKASMREVVRTLSLYQSACYFKDEYELTLSVDEIILGINQTIEHFYIHQIQPKFGVLEFLNKLKQAGIKMCITTASERYLIEEALKMRYMLFKSQKTMIYILPKTNTRITFLSHMKRIP